MFIRSRKQAQRIDYSILREGRSFFVMQYIHECTKNVNHASSFADILAIKTHCFSIFQGNFKTSHFDSLLPPFPPTDTWTCGSAATLHHFSIDQMIYEYFCTFFWKCKRDQLEQ